MKIFGIKIFKEPEYKVKNDLIDNFIINLSLKENIKNKYIHLIHDNF